MSGTGCLPRAAAGRAKIRALALALLVVPALALAGDTTPRRFELAIANGAVAAGQRLVRVLQGEQVRLHITSDAPGEVHLHGYRKEAKLIAGRATELAFHAHATGRYRIEWHPAGDKTHGTDHHGPALATLEVRPR